MSVTDLNSTVRLTSPKIIPCSSGGRSPRLRLDMVDVCGVVRCCIWEVGKVGEVEGMR